MSLSFERKGQIFDYLGNPERWESVFDDEFYKDTVRKYRTQISGNVKISYPPDEPENGHFILTHIDTGAFLEFTETDIGFTVTDERGITVHSNTPYLEPRKDSLPLPANTIPDGLIARIKHLEISVSFTPDGDKNISFSNSNNFISLNGPDEKQKEAIRNGRLLHRIIVDQDSFKQLTGAVQNSLALFKLVVARDFAIQPDLRAYNRMATDDEAGYAQLEKLYEEVHSQSGSRRYRDFFVKAVDNRFALMEREWHDTTEFHGYLTQNPSRFSLRVMEDSLHLFTSLDGREKIFSYSRIFDTVAKNLPEPITLSSVTPENFANNLLKGKTVLDQREDKWNYVLVGHKGDFAVVNDLRDKVKETLQIDGNELAFINSHPTLSIVAIRSETLEAIKDREPFYKPEVTTNNVTHMPNIGSMG